LAIQPGDIPGELMVEYYGQRASEGGLIISEATTISISGPGWFGSPDLYADDQVFGWKRVVDAVHAKGGRMFSQLWHTGRSSHVEMTNGAMPVALLSFLTYYGPDASAVFSAPSGWQEPSPHGALDVSEIPGIVEDYGKAVQRAKAGFDGVELHAANATCPMNFCRMAATSEPMPMESRLPTEQDSCWKLSKRSSRSGAETALLSELGRAVVGTKHRFLTKTVTQDPGDFGVGLVIRRHE